MNHPVLVDSAEPHHRGSGKQIQDHLLRRSGLQPRRAGNRFGSRIGRDGDARLPRNRRARIRSHADRYRAAPPREFKSAQHVGRGPARGDSNDHIAPRHTRSPQVARAVRRGIFRAFDRMPQRSLATGDNGAHHSGRRTECRRTFRRVENSEPAAGSRANVEKACRRGAGLSRWRPPRAQSAAARGERPSATVASSRFSARRISSVDFRSSPRERGFRCSVLAAFKERPKPWIIIAAANAAAAGRWRDSGWDCAEGVIGRRTGRRPAPGPRRRRRAAPGAPGGSSRWLAWGLRGWSAARRTAFAPDRSRATCP